MCHKRCFHSFSVVFRFKKHAASLWIRGICWVRGCRLLFIYEGQQEERYVM